MASRKRSRQAADPFGDEATLTITLAPTEGFQEKLLVVSSNTIRSVSTVAAGLPSEAEVWDISSIRIDGQPVERATVVAWLNAVMQRIEECDYEPQDAGVKCTAVGLSRLLAFADAVGSRKGILSACADMAHEVQLEIEIPKRASSTFFRLLTDGGAYSIEPLLPSSPVLMPGALVYTSAVECYSLGVMLPFGSLEANTTAVGRLLLAAAQQTEALLFEAQRLELHALTQRMLRFVAACACNPTGIFYNRLDDIFSDRLLDAALPPGATQANKDIWMSSALSMPCGFTNDPFVNKLFDALPTTVYGVPRSTLRGDLEPNRFNAVLCEDVMGGSCGEEVPVELDLFHSGTMRVGNMQWPVQLLLGTPTLGSSGTA